MKENFDRASFESMKGKHNEEEKEFIDGAHEEANEINDRKKSNDLGQFTWAMENDYINIVHEKVEFPAQEKKEFISEIKNAFAEIVKNIENNGVGFDEAMKKMAAQDGLKQEEQKGLEFLGRRRPNLKHVHVLGFSGIMENPDQDIFIVPGHPELNKKGATYYFNCGFDQHFLSNLLFHLGYRHEDYNDAKKTLPSYIESIKTAMNDDEKIKTFVLSALSAVEKVDEYNRNNGEGGYGNGDNSRLKEIRELFFSEK